MKKLLALVLCVMMFVSVLSTNAFADKATRPAHPEFDTGLLAPATSVTANNKAVSNAKENIEYLYGTLAADNAVFGTIKSVDSIISDFAKTLFGDVDSYRGLTGSKLEGNTKVVLRDYIGSEIIRDLIDNRSDYETASTSYKVMLESTGKLGSLTYTGKQTQNGGYIYVDADGMIWGFKDGQWWAAPAGTTVTLACLDDGGDIVDWEATAAVRRVREYKYDPIAYANAFASAATKAISGKDGASLLEALYYQIYTVKVMDQLADKFDDLYDDVVDWEDGTGILSQYHFHDTLDVNTPYGFDTDGFWSPFAMVDPADYPNAISITSAIFAP